MDKEDVLRDRINSLIDNELLSVEMLQEATGIEKDSLEKFLFENGVKLSSDDMKDSQRRLRLFGISDCLIEGMKVPEDERMANLCFSIERKWKQIAQAMLKIIRQRK